MNNEPNKDPQPTEIHNHYHGQQNWASELGAALFFCVAVLSAAALWAQASYYDHQLELNPPEITQQCPSN